MTIFLGVRLSKADMSESAQWLVVGCVAYHFFIEIVLTAIKYSSMSKSRKGTDTDDTDELQLQAVGN